MGYFGQSITLYTEQLAKEYSEKLIQEALHDDLIALIGSEGITKQATNASGNVVYSYIDTYKANKIRTEASKNMAIAIETINEHQDFKNIKLPFGYFFSRNIFLSNGIKVPIDLQVVGSHKIEIVSNVIEYGINSSVIEIMLEITVDVQVVIPFQSSSVLTKTQIPLSLEVINSEVPKYYFSGNNGSIPSLIIGE